MSSTDYNPKRRKSIGEIGLEIERNRQLPPSTGLAGAAKYEAGGGAGQGEGENKSERARGRDKRRSSIEALKIAVTNGIKNLF
mmetsp:Transcript_23641/g.49216  ORF Transcript_23641/g.49216 Transcript_23641/m.49216 type:complete len:83 (+) Transcript_23641:60-308(+)|eukprot:CAMPEP_0182457900 /NCGR_PEP_ID=MMETSP1319-20130603/3367_1 /TAXON_ID=172717 /ORGANISM="Bolidomonas pacifica, Strain RCC208" /LENGTH=82 /DNA_ID=CAMNT_0024656467 /DNA_START=58 /DNA_END=306 /DNA_ORIENTATION=+